MRVLVEAQHSHSHNSRPGVQHNPSNSCPQCRPKLQAIPSPDPATYSSGSDMYKTRWTCQGCSETKETWALTTTPDPEQPVQTLQCLVVDQIQKTPQRRHHPPKRKKQTRRPHSPTKTWTRRPHSQQTPNLGERGTSRAKEKSEVPLSFALHRHSRPPTTRVP